MTVWRGNSTMDVTAKLGELPSDQGATSSTDSEKSAMSGLEVENLTPALREQLHVSCWDAGCCRFSSGSEQRGRSRRSAAGRRDPGSESSSGHERQRVRAGHAWRQRPDDAAARRCGAAPGSISRSSPSNAYNLTLTVSQELGGCKAPALPS